MQTIQMLRQLTQVDGVAGGEDRALAVAQEICENLGECSRTIQKSLVCQVMPPQEGRPHLLLDAHIDEIGLLPTSRTTDFCGSDRQAAWTADC